MNISNSDVGKYRATQKSTVFLILAPVNKSIKFWIKRNKNYYFLFFIYVARSNKNKKRTEKVGSLVQTSDPAGHCCMPA
jgi:hypothetical protein